MLLISEFKILLFTFLAVRNVFGWSPVPLSYYQRLNDGSYNYGYNAGGGFSARQSANAANEVTGQYSQLLPDGKIVNVRYKAGVRGFQPLPNQGSWPTRYGGPTSTAENLHGIQGNYVPNGNVPHSRWNQHTGSDYNQGNEGLGPHSGFQHGAGHTDSPFRSHNNAHQVPRLSNTPSNVHNFRSHSVGSHNISTFNGDTPRSDSNDNARGNNLYHNGLGGHDFPYAASPNTAYQPNEGSLGKPNGFKELATPHPSLASHPRNPYIHQVGPQNDRSYSFAYRTPESTRQETANSEGKVHGSYSFRNAGGNHDLSFIAGPETGFQPTGGSLAIANGLGRQRPLGQGPTSFHNPSVVNNNNHSGDTPNLGTNRAGQSLSPQQNPQSLSEFSNGYDNQNRGYTNPFQSKLNTNSAGPTASFDSNAQAPGLRQSSSTLPKDVSHNPRSDDGVSTSVPDTNTDTVGKKVYDSNGSNQHLHPLGIGQGELRYKGESKVGNRPTGDNFSGGVGSQNIPQQIGGATPNSYSTDRNIGQQLANGPEDYAYNNGVSNAGFHDNRRQLASNLNLPTGFGRNYNHGNSNENSRGVGGFNSAGNIGRGHAYQTDAGKHAQNYNDAGKGFTETGRSLSNPSNLSQRRNINNQARETQSSEGYDDGSYKFSDNAGKQVYQQRTDSHGSIGGKYSYVSNGEQKDLTYQAESVSGIKATEGRLFTKGGSVQ